MDALTHANQSYCVPDCTIINNIFLLCNVIELSERNALDLGLWSLDQEKAFDEVDHAYLFTVLRAFGLG